jgi:amino acid transporter
MSNQVRGPVAGGGVPSDSGSKAITLESGKDYGELNHGAVGLTPAMAMSLAYISPTIGVIFISALIASHAGASAPFSFIIGTIGVALMASTLAQFSMRVSSAGTFYTFIARSLGSPVGFVAGWLLLLAYGLQSPLNTNLFGSFVTQLLKHDFGWSLPWWLFSLAIIAFVGVLAWYSVTRSLTLDLIFVIAEVTVVGILLILIVVKGGASGQAPKAFTPTLSPSGFSGIGLAFVYIIFAFFGFESSTTVSEEVENPKRNVPIALIGSVVLTGVWFTLALYAIIVGYGVNHVSALAGASAPVSDLATRYIGGWYSTLVDLAAISANIAVLIAIHNANFRIIYSCGRERLLPRIFGKTHPVFKTPHMAIIGYSVLSAIFTLVFGLLWGPMQAFGNVGYFSSLAMLPIYMVTNLALIVFMWTYHRDEFSYLLHGIFPVLSILVFIGPLVTSLYPFPAAPLNIFPFVTVAWILIGIGWMLWLRANDRPKLDLIGQVIFLSAENRDVENPSPAMEQPIA